MKYSLKSTVLWIQDKIKVDARISFDDNNPPLKETSFNGITSVVFNPMTVVIVSILRPKGDGGYTEWSPNYSIMLSKYRLPIFYRELKAIYEGMKIPNLYHYIENQLELDPMVGDQIRRVFMIGPVNVELSPIVIAIDSPNGLDHVEGIKMKFNTDPFSVMLTLNEVYSLIWNLDHIDLENISLQMYNSFVKTGQREFNYGNVPNQY